MSTTINYNSKESASEFTPLVVVENGQDSLAKIVPNLSLHMDHEDSSPLLNRDSDNSSPDSDLDPLVSDVYSLSNGLVKPSATDINQSFSGGNTPLLSHDDSSSPESSSTLDSEAGPQVDYMPLGELDGALSDRVSSNENSQDDSHNLTAEASGSLSYSQLEAEKSADVDESCICTTTEAEPLPLDFKSSTGRSQNDGIELQEELFETKAHAGDSSVGSSSLMESQDLTTSQNTLTDSSNTIVEPLSASCSNGRNSEVEDGEKLAVDTPDESMTVAHPGPSEAETISLQQSDQKVLEQPLGNSRLSTVLESNENHTKNESVEEESHQATVSSGAPLSTQEVCSERNSEHQMESSENADPTATQGDKTDIPSSPERQAGEEDVISPPSTNGDDQGSSNLDRSTRGESNLDTGVRSDLPVLQPLSPKHGLDQQYEYLRRTLSHSRGRYSTRRRRQHGSRGDDPGNSVSHGRLKHTESLNHHGPREEDPGNLSAQKHGRLRHTESLIHYGARQQQIRERIQGILKSTEPAEREGDSVVEALVDQHGRRYYMDHNTRTIAYEEEQRQTLGGEPDMQARREMLNRRYRSLQRSFRRVQSERGNRGRGGRGLSPILSPADPDNLSLSLTPEEVASINRTAPSAHPHSLTQPSSKPKKQRGSSKSGRWLFFGRRSNKHISQESTSNEDDILPISSPVGNGSIGDNLWFPGENLDVEDGERSSREASVGSEGGGVDSVERSRSMDRRRADAPSEERREREDNEEPLLHQQSASESAVEEPVAGSSSAATESGDVSRLIEAVTTEETDNVTSPTLDQLGRQHSIMRATGLTETDRAAALKARHRVRATTMGSTVRRSPGAAVGAARVTVEEEEHDTDEETNEGAHQMSTVTVFTPHKEEGEREEEEELVVEEKESHKSQELSAGLLESPALKFITRKDLYTFLSSAGESGEEFFANRALMELVQRIRANHSLFDKYQHSRHLVVALNRFADIEADLPEGWEKKLNRQGKVFFIDHPHCLTTFVDPRLPLPDQQFTYTTPSQSIPTNRKVNSYNEPTVRPHHTTITHSPSPAPSPSSASVTTGVPLSALASSPTASSGQLSYEDQVVAFFRQPDVVGQISQRYRRGVRPQLMQIIEDIRLNGTTSLARIQMSGSIAAYELTLILSLFEEDISHIQPRQTLPQVPPTVVVSRGEEMTASTLQRQKAAFSTKLQTFKVMMARIGFAQSSRLKFNIRRNHLLEDAYEHVMKSEIRHLQKKKLNITFRGEEGLDYGGPSREFFFLLSREIFNPYYGLFEYSANDTYTVQISPTSSFIQNNLDWFRFAGRIIALTISQGFLLDVFFTRTVYKSLLGRPAALKDLESLEPAFYNSLLWIQENDPEPLDLTFTVEEEAFGQLTMHELKSGGMDIPVTDENKHEYISLMIQWRLDQGVAKQMDSLKKGFNEVVPNSLLQDFDAQELEFITAGTLEIDVDDWRTHTEYRNGYHADHPVVQWFWQAVEMFDNEQRLRLLQFVTGTSSVPFEGFKALRGSNGPKRFTIDFFNDIKSLPRTHTCFNRIDLPPYPSFEILYEKLRIAVEEGNTFGIE